MTSRRRSPLGLRHYNLSISTSDQMIAHKFRGKLDRASVISEMVAAVRGGQGRPGRETIGVNAEDGSRTDDGFLLEFAARGQGGRGGPGALLRHDRRRDAGPDPGALRQAGRGRAACRSRPTATTTSGMAVANSVSGALGDLDAGQDAWVNTCVNGIGERSGNADLLSCILALQPRLRRGRARGRIGDPLDLTWARRFALWASYAFGQPLPQNQPGVGPQRVRARVGHPRRRRAEGPAELRAVRRRHAGPVPGRLVRPGGPGRADRRVRREGRLPARHGGARGSIAEATRT